MMKKTENSRNSIISVTSKNLPSTQVGGVCHQKINLLQKCVFQFYRRQISRNINFVYFFFSFFFHPKPPRPDPSFLILWHPGVLNPFHIETHLVKSSVEDQNYLEKKPETQFWGFWRINTIYLRYLKTMWRELFIKKYF